jgi:hypothetical protein
VPTPTENQDQNTIQDLSQDEVQAIWNEESEARRTAQAIAAGTMAPPDPKTEAEPSAEGAKDGDKPAEDKKEGKPAAAKKDAKSKGEQTPAAGEQDEDPVTKRFSALEQQLKRAEGRIAAMQRDQAAAAKKATEKSDDAPSQSQQAAALKDPEKWAALKKEFPEWGEAINDFLTANLPKGGLTEDQVAAQVEARLEAKAAERESQRIERVHPSWTDTVKSEEFIAWRKAQDERVNALGASPFAEDAIEMLDLFEKRNEKPAPVKDLKTERANRLAAAATTQRAHRSTPTPKDDNELTAKEIWQQEAQRRAKKRAEEALL